MNFFSDLHRSIFDPDFGREIVKRSGGRIALFLLMALVFSAFVMCVSKTYYLLHPERGIAPLVSVMFRDVEISGGRLVTERETPFGVPGDMLTELMNRLAGSQRFFGSAPDDFLVVNAAGIGISGADDSGSVAGTDSAANAANMLNAAKVVLGETAVEFRDMRMSVPYKVFVGGGDFQFTAEAVRSALNRNAISFAFGFLMVNLFFGFFTMLMSVFFLSLAAYVFRADRGNGYKIFVKLACYFITPVVLGDALVSISGVSADWMWHVFIILSTVLMFRAMTRLQAPANKETINE